MSKLHNIGSCWKIGVFSLSSSYADAELSQLSPELVAVPELSMCLFSWGGVTKT